MRYSFRKSIQFFDSRFGKAKGAALFDLVVHLWLISHAFMFGFSHVKNSFLIQKTKFQLAPT